jgi:very-short-patch-repair endonuclease
VTALVLAPENTMLDELLDDTTRKEVNTYRQQALAKTAVQRQQDAKDKTGVESGVFALHPLTGEQLPIWFADYVLADYGSGAVMMVPAHDERDGEFAEKFGIEIREVIVDESPLPIPLLGGEGTVKDASLRQYKATPEYIVDLAKTLRTKQTSTEHVFREIVRAKRFYDTKWRRQHPFGRYIADFYCHTYKLAIELDGVTHDSIEAQAYDAIRTEFINNYDVVVLRFSNDDISTNLDGVFEKIADHMNNFSLLAGESEREVFTGYGILIHSENYT